MPNAYTIYGLTLISEMTLPELRSSSAPPSDTRQTVHIHLETNARRTADSLPLVYTSPYRTSAGVPRLHIYRDAPGLFLRFADIADFLVRPSSVTVMPAEGSDPMQVRQFLLGPALAVELELLGVPCLHASAVAVKGGAVGFLAVSTGGKSVLASSLVEAGAALLTDDILPLRRQGDAFVGSPGYAQMKVWPQAAQELLGADWENLDRVVPGMRKRRLPVGPNWGAFCNAAQPLLALYVPTLLGSTDREENEVDVEIAPVAPSDALIELVRYSFCARPADALGWQPRRLSFLAELVRCVPVRRLRYLSGFEHLPAVHAAIRRDLSP